MRKNLTGELDAAWLAEIQRRAKDVDEGRVKMLDGDEVMARLTARLKSPID